MSPTVIIALIRDAAILGALGFVVLWIRNEGAQSVKKQDLKAVQSQLADNALRQQQYAQEARDAQTQHSHDVETISAAIAAHSIQPVLVRIPAGPGTMHGVSATTPGQPTSRGGTHEAARDDPESAIDVRAAVSQFELTYESALADCRQALAIWPH